MSALARFLLFNLAASLAGGLLAWAAVMLTLRLLRARSAFLYASFLALPLVKSIFVLLGIGLVFPWNIFTTWQRLALQPAEILPLVVGWFAAAWLALHFLARRARLDVLAQAAPPGGEEGRRLSAALDSVLRAYRQSPCCEAGETVCCLSDQIPADPRLLLSDQLRSPVALVEGGGATILFPRELLQRLDDPELALALAHELNHFALRRPGGWSAGSLRTLALVSPVALLLAEALHREEEKACDDLAVRMLGTPEIYAGMLMKSYQFACQPRPARWPASIPILPELIGARPFLSQRIERQLQPHPAAPRWYQSRTVVWPVWMAMCFLLFFARFGA